MAYLDLTKKGNKFITSKDVEPEVKSKVPSTDTFDRRPKTKFVKIENKKNKVDPEVQKKRKKIWMIVFSILGIIFIILGIVSLYLVVLPLQRVNASVQNMQSEFSSILDEFKNKDLSNIDERFQAIQVELTKINTEIDRYEFLSTWEQTKGYYDNFQIGRGILKKSSDLLDTTLPELKNILKTTGFKTEKSIADEGVITPNTSAEKDKDSAVSLVMKELPQYLKLYDSIEPDINAILSEIKKINMDYVPNIGGYDFKAKFNELNKFVDKFPDISAKTKNFLRNVPDLVGSNKPTKFLLILQNETEMRSSGGLLTAYGHLELKNGEIGDVFLSDMWNLQHYVEYLQNNYWNVNIPYLNIHGQDFLMNHNCGATSLRAQDAGIYPDLYVTSDMLKTYYDYANKYNPKEYPAYDYIITLNHNFAATLISLVQPLDVPGLGSVNSDNLYDIIKSETDAVKNYGDPNRKSILKEIANVAKKRFQDLSVKDMPNIIQSMIRSIQAKDVSLASTKNVEMQAYFDEYGLTARTIKDFKGDYFQLGEAQNCALKLNRWLRDEINLTVNIDDTGKIRNEAYIKWNQPKVYTADLYGQYSAIDRFWYRAWVRIITPKNTDKFVSDGLKKSKNLFYRPIDYYDKIMDKEVSDNVIMFDHRRLKESDPVPTQDLRVKYELPNSINYNKDGKYKLLVQKHPGKPWGEPQKVTILHRGSTYSVNFILDRDKVVTYQDGVITVDNYDQKLDWILDLAHKVPWDKLQ